MSISAAVTARSGSAFFASSSRYSVSTRSKVIASFRSMANANEITNDSYRLIESMVEQAGERAIPEIDPTLVLLLEMLEHVKDPGLVPVRQQQP